MLKLAKALALAADQCKARLDRGGNPYFLHCVRVMQTCGLKSEDALCAAILHDYIEDAKDQMKAWDSIIKAGMSNRTRGLLFLLTRDGSLSYDDYIKRIATDKEATAIKIADLRDNTDITRLKGISKKDLDRVEKYHRSFLYLSGA